MNLLGVYLLLGLHVLISAGTYVVAKFGLAEIGPMTFAIFRFSLSVSGVSLVAWLAGKMRAPEYEDLWTAVLVGFVGYPLNQAMFLVGISLAPPVHASLFYSLTPLFVMILAFFLIGERITWLKATGVFAALSGVFFVLMEPVWKKGEFAPEAIAAGMNEVFQLGSLSFQGDILLLLSAVSWSLYTVLGKPLIKKYGPIVTTTWAQMAGWLLFIPTVLLVFWLVPELRDPFVVPVDFFGVEQMAFGEITLPAWGSVLYLGLITSVGAYLIWYYCVNHLETAKVAVSINLQPAATAILSVLFWKQETFTPLFFLGLGLAGLGVYLTQRG